MKSLIALFSLMLIIFFMVPASAQHSAHHPGEGQAVQSDTTAGMMQGGMRSGMMGQEGIGCPMCNQKMKGSKMGGSGMMQGGIMGNMMKGMHGDGMGMMGSGLPIMKKHKRLINKLPRMKTALSLEDNQVEKLQQMQNGFQKSQIDMKALLAKNKIDLNAAIDKDAPASDIRSALKEMADIKINMAVQTYETANNMKKVLNAEQIEKLKKQKSGCMMGDMMR